ncbi:Rpn family recombination-promoting nuclease/putative transposase [Vibrio parahaemolyticus]|nr:Rpn family recombination-promoting nuclease/putative transposase [Vibrio parahaemolyticus]EGQ9799539.1 Rpn family recombination-promoting nuclease/putative transposase [Vibrio parahaemolyticus]EGR1753039.1 hypothetical protein [Vibrio parahaemolyticus]EIA0904595.1 Rpn family recombination-promoting nuclease/putative transposase [Vibrio parahaemolyticus]EIK4819062.1 Rpn family recombination-promoting nuclease/putative transposase [Vibrio parahaemolyticus]
MTTTNTDRDLLTIHRPPTQQALCHSDTLKLESNSFIKDSIHLYISDALYSM